IEPSPVRCVVSEVKYATCGGDFTVWLSSVDGASIQTAGLPQYGQLGHGTDNEVWLRKMFEFDGLCCPKMCMSSHAG
ncbi:protein RCC2-like, partial [Trifolium medium]|nr:protein RCC2-like [Trifolium medium]